VLIHRYINRERERESSSTFIFLKEKNLTDGFTLGSFHFGILDLERERGEREERRERES